MTKNTYGSWYVSYKQAQQKSQKAPYRVVKIENDIGVPIVGLENARIEAFSSAQARILFLRKYPKLQDYLSAGLKVEAELDDEMLRQRQQIAEMEQQKKEEFVQNAWWNK